MPNLVPKPKKRVFGHFFCPKFNFEATFRKQKLKVRSLKVALKITFGQWECSKLDFDAKTPKSTFLNETEKHHSNFFFLLLFAIDVSQKQKKSEKNHSGYAVDPYMWILHFLAFLALLIFFWPKFKFLHVKHCVFIHIDPGWGL